MTRITINKLIGYGILLFVIGFVAGFAWFKYMQLLIPMGTLITFAGIFYFFKETDLNQEFYKRPEEDLLTYFWNAIVLKLWTFIFVIWMLILNLILIFSGFQ